MVETLLEWADALVSKKWEWVIPLWLLWLLQHLQCQQNICYQNNHYQFTLHPFGPKVFYSKDMDFDPRYLRTWVLKYMLKLLFMMANWPFNNNFLFEFRIHSLHFLIFSFFPSPCPFPLSKIVLFCRKMLKMALCRGCHKKLNIRATRNNSGLNSLRESFASCVGLHWDMLDPFIGQRLKVASGCKACPVSQKITNRDIFTKYT